MSKIIDEGIGALALCTGLRVGAECGCREVMEVNPHRWSCSIDRDDLSEPGYSFNTNEEAADWKNVFCGFPEWFDLN